MKKSKSANEKKKQSVRMKIDGEALNGSFPAAASINKRKELLARVAGSIAAGLVTSPSPSIATPSTMAMAAVDIAEEILKKAGIPSVEPHAETSASGSADVGQAS